MMAQALGYLGLDYPAVRADNAGGFAGPVPDADFIVWPSRLQHPCCAVGVFLQAAKGAAYRSPGFRSLRVSTSAFTYINLIRFTQVIFSRMRVAFPELFSCLCESFHDSPPSTEAQARARSGRQPVDDGGFAGAGYKTLGHPAQGRGGCGRARWLALP